MSSEDHRHLMALFQKACDIDAADRSRFLDEACGDDEDLRERLERMLVHDAARVRKPQGAGAATSALLDDVADLTGAAGATYCMLCGENIGAAEHCPNPDCEALPNTYRHVPGPSAPLANAATVPAASPAMPEAPRGKSAPAAAARAARNTLRMSGSEKIAVLIGSKGTSARRVILGGTMTIGADPSSDWHLDSPRVSALHARIDCIRAPEGAWSVTLTDCDSTNGTEVNGEPVAARELRDGDRVRLADLQFRFKFLRSDGPRLTMRM